MLSNSSSLALEIDYVQPQKYIMATTYNYLKWLSKNGSKNRWFEYNNNGNNFSDTATLVDNEPLSLLVYYLLNQKKRTYTYVEQNQYESSVSMWDMSGNRGYSDILKLNNLKWDNKFFVFSEQIDCNIKKVGLYFVLSYSPLSMEVFSKSIDSLTESFKEEFDTLWRVYAEEDDENLSYDAIQLKNRLKRIVKEVKHCGDTEN